MKLAGRSTLNFPRRECFNENTSQTIAEQRKNVNLVGSLSKHKINTEFGKINGSIHGKELNSTKSLTKTELSRFFRDTTKKIDEDAKSRMTEISRGRYLLKNPLGTKDKDKSNEDRNAEQSPGGSDEEKEANDMFDAEVDKDKPTGDEPTAEDLVEDALEAVIKEEEPVPMDDAMTEATGDGVSMAPTEMLAVEYKKLMSQYDSEI